jgi:hypothetical protein
MEGSVVDMTALDDFSNADFGDKRLNRRLVTIAKRLAPNPSQSFPKAAESEAALEATYRFFQNDKVTPAAILAPHIAATVERAAAQGLVLVPHDTTELSFSTEREGLGRLNDAGQGLFAHIALAVSAEGMRQPLGILGMLTYTQPQKPKRQKHTERIPPSKRQSYRWTKLVEQVEERFDGHAEAVHLLDSEADAYLLLAHMVSHKRRFVVRLKYDRRVTDQAGNRHALGDVLENLEGIFEREVPLSPRAAPKRTPGSRKRNLPRETRLARLEFTATRVLFHAPHGEQTSTKSIAVHVVHVRELDVPEGMEAVDWRLVTTEPIGSAADVGRIVDFYRTRWVIEELFKALKTGCAIEKRQLESRDALCNALALLLPIACDLLALRILARVDPERPAHTVLSAPVLRVLQMHTRTKLAETATVREAMLAVARFGGHITRNGDPGWMVLGRGYDTVLLLAEGLVLSAGNTAKHMINP